MSTVLSKESHVKGSHSSKTVDTKATEGRESKFEMNDSSKNPTGGKSGLKNNSKLDFMKSVGAEGDDDLGLFLDDSQHEALQSLELLRHYLKEWESRYGEFTGDYERTIWFDDRSTEQQLDGSVAEKTSDCNNPLTATGLFRALERKFHPVSNLVIRQRSLIYTTDPSPDCIRALIRSATCKETEMLRTIIEKYLAFHTSILVSPDSRGFSTSHLALHLPFLKLRKVPKKEKTSKTNANPIRERMDVSFLNLDASEPENEKSETWELDEVQASIALTWTDESRWRGLGFVDSEILGRLDMTLEPDDFLMDFLLAGKHPTSPPIWSPQEYFLRMLEVWLGKANTELKHLVSVLEHSIKAFNNEHPCTLSEASRSLQEQKRQLNTSFDLVLKMTTLLRRVHGLFSDTTEELRSFLFGDVEYFRDYGAFVKGSFAFKHLQEIRIILKDLEARERKIVQLEKNCAEYSRTLELRLFQQSKEANEKNKVSTDFNVMIGLPATLTFALFSIPQFEMGPRSILISLLLLTIGVNLARYFLNLILWFLPSIQERIFDMFMKKAIVGTEGEEKSPSRAGFMSSIFPRRPVIPPDIPEAS